MRWHDNVSSGIVLRSEVPNDAPHGLTKGELCLSIGKIGHDAQPLNIDPFGDHGDRHQPAFLTVAKRRDFSIRVCDSVVNHHRLFTIKQLEKLGHILRNRNIWGNNKAAGLWHPKPEIIQLIDAPL